MLTVLAQHRTQPYEGALQGLRDRATVRVVMALLADELDDVVNDEQGRLMACMPVHDDCAEHDISTN